MLLWIFDYLASGGSLSIFGFPLDGLGKITLRAALAAMLSFGLAIALGPRCIGWLLGRFREPIKSDSAEIAQLHQFKQSTPTMGGLFIFAGIFISVLLFGDLSNRFVLLGLLLAMGLAILGASDDLIKLFRPAKGLSVKKKLLGQVAICTVVACFLYPVLSLSPEGTVLRLPFIGLSWSLGWWLIPWSVLVLVGASNAVNLTDGLDGLAGGCLLSSIAALSVLIYASGHATWAAYLHVPRIYGAGELSILCGGMAGGVLGFLWFNCHPAQVFMGDTGSLPLGGLLGFLALVARGELLLLLIGGVFVIEALSVLLQVGYYKWRRKRLLLCSPLHHHFQLRGWAESKIVTRFWIAGALCALMGLASLKVGVSGERMDISREVLVNKKCVADIESISRLENDQEEFGDFFRILSR